MRSSSVAMIEVYSVGQTPGWSRIHPGPGGAILITTRR